MSLNYWKKIIKGPPVHAYLSVNLRFWALPIYVAWQARYLSVHVGPARISFDWSR